METELESYRVVYLLKGVPCLGDIKYNANQAGSADRGPINGMIWYLDISAVLQEIDPLLLDFTMSSPCFLTVNQAHHRLRGAVGGR